MCYFSKVSNGTNYHKFIIMGWNDAKSPIGIRKEWLTDLARSCSSAVALYLFLTLKHFIKMVSPQILHWLWFFFSFLAQDYHHTQRSNDLRVCFHPSVQSLKVHISSLIGFSFNFFSHQWKFPISSARLIRDPETQRPKGFGFVTFQSPVEAKKALQAMDGRVCVLHCLCT